VRRGTAKKGAETAQQRWKRARLSLSFPPAAARRGLLPRRRYSRLLSPLSPCLSLPWPFCDGSGSLRRAAVITVRIPVSSARRRAQKRALRTLPFERFIQFRRKEASRTRLKDLDARSVRVRSHTPRGERRKLPSHRLSGLDRGGEMISSAGSRRSSVRFRCALAYGRSQQIAPRLTERSFRIGSSG